MGSPFHNVVHILEQFGRSRLKLSSGSVIICYLTWLGNENYPSSIAATFFQDIGAQEPGTGEDLPNHGGSKCILGVELGSVFSCHLAAIQFLQRCPEQASG